MTKFSQLWRHFARSNARALMRCFPARSLANVMRTTLLLLSVTSSLMSVEGATQVLPYSRHGGVVHRHLGDNIFENVNELPFRRYFVNLRGTTSDSLACSAPTPSITITCGASLRLIDVDNTTTCLADGKALNCTGTGSVLVDCQATSDDELEDFLQEQSLLRVEMNVPSDEFVCVIPHNEFVGHGIFVGIVCDNNLADFTQITCSPEELFVDPAISEPLCLNRCTQQVCTNAKLVPFVAGVTSSDACYWDPTTSASPTLSLAPSNTPSKSPAPTATSVPTTSPAPTSTPAPTGPTSVPSVSVLSNEKSGETMNPTFVWASRASSGNRRMVSLSMATIAIMMVFGATCL